MKHEKAVTEARITGVGENKAKTIQMETRTEKDETMKSSTHKQDENVTIGETQQDKETRAGSESCYDTTESEWRGEPTNVRRKKSITQKIKGMLRKSDAKAKEKPADKGEAGDGGSKRGLSFKYYRRKGKDKIKGKGKEGSAGDSKVETEDELAMKGKKADPAGRQQGAGGSPQQKSPDKSENQATQQHQKAAGPQQGSAVSASQQQASLTGRDTQSATVLRKPDKAGGPKSASEQSTPAREKSPAAVLQQQESEASSYATANSTMRRSSRKPRLTRTKRFEAFPSTCDTGSPRSPPPDHKNVNIIQEDITRGSRDTRESLKGRAEDEEGEEEDETTRLLNRVLRAIQILEKERPELMEEVKEEEKGREEEEVAQRPPDQLRTIGRMKVSHLYVRLSSLSAPVTCRPLFTMTCPSFQV